MDTFYVFLLFLIAILLVVSNNGLSSSAASTTADFNKDFHLIKEYASNHVQTSSDGKTRNLFLDKYSGAGFISKNKFLFGQFEMKIKLIKNKPAGTVVAFYLTSDYYHEANHDEIDFEFLGNVHDKPYVLQTNLFINGIGNREEKITLWFDPTKHYHNYSILWNTNQIVFTVDSKVIRAITKKENQPYPNGLPMSLVTTIWDGSGWATRTKYGKLVPIDWTKAPFNASAKDAKMDACAINKWKNNQGFCASANKKNWWNQQRFTSLTLEQKKEILWVRRHYHYG